jgi:hypothetical protein
MGRRTTLVMAGVATALAASLAAQTTGMPSYNAPYRAFQRSELGAVVSFPDGHGTGYEGAYRYASGRFDIGLRVGIYDPGSGAKTVLLVGGEGRDRVITHSADFPLDGALVAGIGAGLVSGNSTLYIPVGVSLGRRVEPRGSTISFVPYVQPTALIIADGGSDLFFTLGMGVDARLSRVIDARLSAGVGDLHGVSLAAVWVH